MSFDVQEVVRLPIGLDWGGTRYREVHISEMKGVDQQNMSARKIRNNGAKALTMFLRRAILAIPGLVDSKDKENSLIEEKMVRGMYACDRDYLFMVSRLLGEEPEFDMMVTCPKCREQTDIDVDIRTLDVYEVEDDQEPTFFIELPSGMTIADVHYTHAMWRFPRGSQSEKVAELPEHKQPVAIIASCVTLYTKDKAKQSHVDFETAKNMKFRDQQFLLEVSAEFTPGVDTRIEAHCSNGKCQWEWLATLDMQQFFESGRRKGKARIKRGKGGFKRKKRGS